MHKIKLLHSVQLLLFLGFLFFKTTMLTAQKAQVFFALDTECPMSQKYTSTIKALQKTFPSVEWIGLFTPWDNDSTIQLFLTEYELKLPYQIDKEYAIFKKMDGKVVPEVYFFSEKNELLYRGAIDNWFYELGKYRPAPTENYLHDAVAAYLRNDCILIEKTTALGCILEY
jgi:hypothetical protein